MAAAPTYSKTHRALHWATVGLMLMVFPVGVFISDVPGEGTSALGVANSAIKNFMYDWHKWFGLVILVATALRLAYKFTHPVAHATDITPMERTISHVVHVLLYMMLFGVPLGGWAATNALGFPIYWFWVIPLPNILPRNPDLGFQLLEMHQWAAWGLCALFMAHIGAALMHFVVKKDSVLGRMMPRLAARSTTARPAE